MELWTTTFVSINISILNPPQRPCSALQGLDQPSPGRNERYPDAVDFNGRR